jgi:hypothetical protein
MHNLVVSCLVVAYLSANVYAIVKVRVFELEQHFLSGLLVVLVVSDEVRGYIVGEVVGVNVDEGADPHPCNAAQRNGKGGAQRRSAQAQRGRLGTRLVGREGAKLPLGALAVAFQGRRCRQEQMG